MRIYVYGERFYTQTIQAFFEGVVNKYNLMGWMLKQTGAEFPTVEGAEVSDIGKWLLMDLTSKRLRNDCFEYQMVFKYSSIGWNKVRDANGTAQDRVIYHTYDFTSILKDMNYATPDESSIR